MKRLKRMGVGCYLDEDVLLEVLSKFHEATYLTRLSLVCKTWRRLCTQVPEIELDAQRIGKHELHDMIRSTLGCQTGLKVVRIIGLSTRLKVDELLDKFLLPSSSTLCKLVLSFQRSITTLKCTNLWRTIGLRFPSLAHLEILGVTLINYTKLVVDGLRLNSLGTLILSGYVDQTFSIEAVIKACPNITKLQFCDPALRFAEHTLESSTLKDLSLSAVLYRQNWSFVLPSLEKLDIESLTWAQSSTDLFLRNLRVLRLSDVEDLKFDTVEALVTNSQRLEMLHVHGDYDWEALCLRNAAALKRVVLKLGDVTKVVFSGCTQLENVELKCVKRLEMDESSVIQLRTLDVDLEGCWVYKVLLQVPQCPALEDLLKNSALEVRERRLIHQPLRKNDQPTLTTTGS